MAKKKYDITQIDFSDLRNQKRELLKVINERNLPDGKDDLNGILNLIDSIQDHACDILGYNENEVFDLHMDDPDYHPEPLYPVNPNEPEEETFAREMADIIYDLHREGTYLYEHEAMSEEFVETILNDPANVQACKELIRKDILDEYRLDARAFKRNANTNELCYDSEMYDYGYVIEGYCLEKFYEGKTKTVYLCKCCQSDNVEIKRWFNPNTGAIGVDCEDPVGYCNDCQLPTTVYVAELKYLAKVIGFQVVSEQGDIHPDMAGSFCIYSLSQAQAMIEKGCNNPNQQWNLLTIWRGDIEEPTIMYTEGVRM